MLLFSHIVFVHVTQANLVFIPEGRWSRVVQLTVFSCILGRLTYDEFVDICRKIPVTTEEDLMKAFRKIDINGDGYITSNELLKTMTTVSGPITIQYEYLLYSFINQF